MTLVKKTLRRKAVVRKSLVKKTLVWETFVEKALARKGLVTPVSRKYNLVGRMFGEENIAEEESWRRKFG